MKKTIQALEIYYADLCKEKQMELLELFRVKSPDEMNWDAFPVAVVYEPEHEGGENIQRE